MYTCWQLADSSTFMSSLSMCLSACLIVCSSACPSIHLTTYLPTYLPTYPPIHLPLCLHVGIWGIGLSLSAFLSHAEMPVTQIHPVTYYQMSFSLPVYISISVSPWLYLNPSLWFYPMYFLTFCSRSPAIRYIHRYQQNSFFSMKPVICGQQSIFPAQHGSKSLTGFFSRPCLWALSAV